jgi:hypothetical protein
MLLATECAKSVSLLKLKAKPNKDYGIIATRRHINHKKYWKKSAREPCAILSALASKN